MSFKVCRRLNLDSTQGPQVQSRQSGEWIFGCDQQMDIAGGGMRQSRTDWSPPCTAYAKGPIASTKVDQIGYFGKCTHNVQINNNNSPPYVTLSVGATRGGWFGPGASCKYAVSYKLI
ncbi:unnamed protein product [Rotaria sp. Silwood1]|nr:unnamed protein product [Rotaria sp. Silwood1]CAF1567965.1 unnamed protein product [Rotaria sp. Silwood1]CAF1569967.1 unnamed protein product [Rotaria sp. Silwood1]